MNIGENIKKYRELKNLSRKDLASKLDLNVSTIGRYESGAREPSIDILGQIATILQVPIDILIGSTLTPVQKDGEFSYMIDSQFGCFDPNFEGYIEFLERNLTKSQKYQKDNMFTSSIIPSFSSDLVTCINKAKQDHDNNLLSIDDLKQFLFDKTGIENIWHLDEKKELSLTDLVKLLNFFRDNYFNEFCNFIIGYSFGYSDLDESIKLIINDYKYSITRTIPIPGGFVIKPNIIDPGLAYQSIVNLLFYVNSGEDLPNIAEPEFELLLKKVCDLLEFELYKLKKEGENSGE